jgi:hypothetical protein
MMAPHLFFFFFFFFFFLPPIEQAPADLASHNNCTIVSKPRASP